MHKLKIYTRLVQAHTMDLLQCTMAGSLSSRT